jgi:hypothetical protein
VSGTHPVHGYRSQHLQLDGRIGEQYLVDGLVEQLSGIPVTKPHDQEEVCFTCLCLVTVP